MQDRANGSCGKNGERGNLKAKRRQTPSVSISAAARIEAASALTLESLEMRRMLSAGSLDTSYGGGAGYKVVDIGSGSIDQVYDSAVQADGKLLVAGSTFTDGEGAPQLFVARFTTSGALDATFGNGGVATLDPSPDPAGNEIDAITVAPDGKIVAVGSLFSHTADYFIARFNPDGTPDSSLGAAGVYFGDAPGEPMATDVAVGADGSIFVVADSSGSHESFVVKHTTDGTPDIAGWGVAGVAIVQFPLESSESMQSIAIDHAGNVLIGGTTSGAASAMTAVRFTPSGVVDPTFGNIPTAPGIAVAGVQSGETGYSLAVGADNSVFVGGFYFDTVNPVTGIEVVHFTPAGQLDADAAPDDGIPAGYGADGSGAATFLDPNDNLFGTDLALDSTGRAVVSGLSGGLDFSETKIAVARFTAAGIPDAGFGPDGAVTIVDIPDSTAEAAAGVGILPDGRIAVGGFASDGIGMDVLALQLGDAAVEPPPPPVTPVFVDTSGNLVIPGTDGDDVFDVIPAAGGAVKVVYNGVTSDAFTFSGKILASGGAGNDVIRIDPSINRAASVSGGAGNDTIVTSGGNDTVTGDAGNDSITTNGGNDSVSGGDGNDVISTGDGLDLIDGGAGDDSISAGAGLDLVSGGAGNDTIDGGTGLDVLGGGDGNDLITGSNDAEAISGGNGDDTIFGNGGLDVISAGAGNDIVVGGAGTDLISGDAGRDILIGGTGGDLIVGVADEDIVIGGTTSFDSNIAALTAIKAEWTSSRTYAQRVANIHNGSGTATRLNGSYFLVADTTVFDDGATDTLSGGASSDWFFYNADAGVRDITDRSGSEVGDDVDVRP